MWPNCLGAVRKAGIRCPHQLVVVGEIRDIAVGGGAAAAGALSTLYVLIQGRGDPWKKRWKERRLSICLCLSFHSVSYFTLHRYLLVKF